MLFVVNSFFPVVYYSFMCMPTWRWIYLSTTVVVGTGTLFVTLLDRFQAPKYSPLRATLFCFLGGSGVFPIFHQTFFTWRVVPTPIVYMLGMELLMGACYLLGAVIYSNAVPEKWRPGMFDVWGTQSQHFPRVGGLRGVHSLQGGAHVDGVEGPPRVRRGRDVAQELVRG